MSMNTTSWRVRVRPADFDDDSDIKWCVDHYDKRGAWEGTMFRESHKEAIEQAKYSRYLIRKRERKS